MENPIFKVGQLVALCETWPTKRVYHIVTIKSVGKRDIKLADNYTTARFKLTGEFWGKRGDVGRWRAILPLTQKLLAQAAQDGASGLERAEGHSFPEE